MNKCPSRLTGSWSTLCRGWVASHLPYKRLFQALIFIDPIIVGSRPDPGTMFSKFLNVKVTGALSRRGHWVSRYVVITCPTRKTLTVVLEKKLCDCSIPHRSSGAGTQRFLSCTWSVACTKSQMVEVSSSRWNPFMYANFHASEVHIDCSPSRRQLRLLSNVAHVKHGSIYLTSTKTSNCSS